MPEYEKSYYFSAVKSFWNTHRSNCLKSITVQQHNSIHKQVEHVSSNTAIAVIDKQFSPKYKLFKVISYAIRGKWGLSKNKRKYYRNKLRKIFTT